MKRVILLLPALLALLLTACQPAPIDNAALIAELEETISALEAQEPLTVEVTREVEVAGAEPSPVPTATPLAIEVTRIVTETVPPPGSADRPVQLIFAPTFENQVTTFRGDALAAAMSEALDLAVVSRNPRHLRRNRGSRLRPAGHRRRLHARRHLPARRRPVRRAGGADQPAL